MNNKGQTIFFLFMMGVVFFILGLGLAPALTKTTSEAMDTDQLDCANTSISNQDKANCTSVDIMPPVFVGVIFGLAGLLIGGIAIR